MTPSRFFLAWKPRQHQPSRRGSVVAFGVPNEIDELYFNAPYFITPQEEDYSNEAFAVIREALNQKGMVAIGRVVFGSREHMLAIKPRAI